jgi:hypothetical protein
MTSPVNLSGGWHAHGAPGFQGSGSANGARRLFVWGTVASNQVGFVAPAAGGRVDGCTPPSQANFGHCAVPGVIVQVETGGSFSAGALLETTNTGKVVQQSSGRVVMRALQASAGASTPEDPIYAFCVFTQS